ncbi:DUF6053 domain-containing protein [Lysobacter enzymogenes]|uniref:DUF6053 domain-containing protein n=1 Tax=Lysobacter enzymogenes TaxID=69 RepID=UPI00384B604D
MGGSSGPTLLSRIAAMWNKSVGPEGPPTKTQRCADSNNSIGWSSSSSNSGCCSRCRGIGPVRSPGRCSTPRRSAGSTSCDGACARRARASW